MIGTRVYFSVTGLNETLTTLMKLPAEVVSKRGGPVKTAVFKASKHVRDVEKQWLDRAIAMRETGRSIGLVRKNIVARRSKMDSSKGERYVVKISRKRYPRNDNTMTGSLPSTLKSAHLLEYGSEKQEATPFIRPAFMQSRDQAFHIMVKELDVGIAKIVKKLNRSKKR